MSWLIKYTHLLIIIILISNYVNTIRFAKPSSKNENTKNLPTLKISDNLFNKNKHYQIVTICNTRPSIIKCQNKQHYLFIHRTLIGIQDLNVENTNECVAKINSLQEYLPGFNHSVFDCTGAKFCVLYPNNNSSSNLTVNRNNSTFSTYLSSDNSTNLVQLHITCASRNDLGKYVSRLNLKDSEIKVSLKAMASLYINTKDILHPFINIVNSNSINIVDSNSIPPKTNFTYVLFQKQNTNSPLQPRQTTTLNENSRQANAIILISISAFYILIAILLITLVYCRLRIRNFVTRTKLGTSKNPSHTFNIEKNSENSENYSFHLRSPELKFTRSKSVDTKISSFSFLKKKIQNYQKSLNKRLIRMRRYVVRVAYAFLVDEDRYKMKTKWDFKNSNRNDIVNYSQSVKTPNYINNKNKDCIGSLSLNLHFSDESSIVDLNERSLRNIQDLAELVSLQSEPVDFENYNNDGEYSLSASESDEGSYNEDNISFVQDLYAYYNPLRPSLGSSTGYNFVLYDIPEEVDYDLEEDQENFVEILKI